MSLFHLFSILPADSLSNKPSYPLSTDGTYGSYGGGGYGAYGYTKGKKTDTNEIVARERLRRRQQQKLDDDMTCLFDAMIFFLPDSSLRSSIPDLMPHELLSTMLRKSPLVDALAVLLRNDSFLEITGVADGWKPPPKPSYGGFPYGGFEDEGDGFSSDEEDGSGNSNTASGKPGAANVPDEPEPSISVRGRSALYFKALNLIRALVEGHEMTAPVVLAGFDTKPEPVGPSTPADRKQKKKKVEEPKAPAPEPEHVPSILEMLAVLLRQADIFVSGLMKSGRDDALDEEKATAALGLALELKTAGEKIQAAADRLKAASNSIGAEPVPQKTAASATYEELLKEHVFGHGDLQIPDDSGKQKIGALSYGPGYNSAPNRGRTLRVAQETATLSTSLPTPSPSSSIFLRIDDDRFDRWRFIISGPTETPYAYGCFVFDISFGQDYPHGPPHVKLLTTGQGTVRFSESCVRLFTHSLSNQPLLSHRPKLVRRRQSLSLFTQHLGRRARRAVASQQVNLLPSLAFHSNVHSCSFTLLQRAWLRSARRQCSVARLQRQLAKRHRALGDDRDASQPSRRFRRRCASAFLVALQG